MAGGDFENLFNITKELTDNVVDGLGGYDDLPDDITAQKFVFDYEYLLQDILFDYYMD